MTNLEISLEATSRFVDTASWRLNYYEAGSGHPVIMLHGSGPGATGWSNFAPNIRSLARSFRVLAVDAPGWGRSPTALPEHYDHPNAVLELMDALDIERAALVGNSMGGATALAFASRYPDRISHLVTMGSGALTEIPISFGPGDGPSEGLKILFDCYREPSLEKMTRLAEIMTFDSKHASPELAQERLNNALANPEHLENFLKGLATGGPVRTRATLSEAASITTPTLLIHGRDDRVVSFEYSLRLLGVIPDSRLVLFNRCGHWAQLEHAEEFNRLVTDFITNT